jgi:UDPglucose--hexose-1-phosphate uridylyltransferase
LNAIEQFTHFIIEQNPQYTDLDATYLFNRVLARVGEDSPAAQTDILQCLDALVDAGVTAGLSADTASARDALAADLMDLAVPAPSVVNAQFWNNYAQSPQQATDGFYALSRASNYIQTRAIARNIAFPVATDYGDLEITINLSKPEKDPRDIAAAAKMQATSYPACALCMSNEGYEGKPGKAARANHRIVRMTVGGKTWGFQYSPYAYFNEHAIFLDAVHEPMHISKQTFTNLLEIVTTLPHYFVGSNADLPIVGGSMLAHEHYQGGRHDFPMAKAPVERSIQLADFSDVQAGIVHWPMSVIRLTAADPVRLADCAERIRSVWADYSDEGVNVRAHAADGTPHHTVTPIARRVGDDYQLDIVLRDNQTSAEYPDGIFHPHQDVQHIKRENIGLIEVMGLAILPARLKDELAEVRKYLLGEPNQMAPMHAAWADELKARYTWNKDNVETQLQRAVGLVFARVLEDAGVFKRDEAGKAAFGRFVAALN